MKNVNDVLVRHGVHAGDLEKAVDSVFRQILEKISTPVVTDDSLQDAIRQIPGLGGETLVDSSIDELPLSVIDPYVRGISRWLTELGIYTIASCDGHNKQQAVIYLKNLLKPAQKRMVKAATPSSIRLRASGKKIHFRYEVGRIEELLSIAENLYAIWVNPNRLIELEADSFKNSIIEWLEIPGDSRNERETRMALKRKLDWLTIDHFTDRKGNLLGYISCGEGPTVLLSAHMDTYETIAPDREIIQDGTILTSSKGILGADDRAGIAIILEVLARIHQTNFNGTIKFAFTVEEEIGLKGSKEIDAEFISDIDAAIVVDRRGTRDIVTSCMGIIPFCSEEYGKLFAEAGRLVGMQDWKITEGGSSDARVYSEKGIPSVNLSAGYGNEHTDREFLDYRAAYETVRLIKAVLGLIKN